MPTPEQELQLALDILASRGHRDPIAALQSMDPSNPAGLWDLATKLA